MSESDTVATYDRWLRFGRRQGRAVDRLQELKGDLVSLRSSTQKNLVAALVDDDLRRGLEVFDQLRQLGLHIRRQLVAERISLVGLR
ncbi:MAG: hypothetical protein JJ992_14025, partial [Planctomycetes bacterium]|nr:hypothetical protein [Planctomycetota bacterium]